MAGGYTAVKGGPEGLAARILHLQRQIDEIRAAAGLKSAVIRGNSIRFEDDNGALNALIGQGSAEFYTAGVLNALIGDGSTKFYSDGVITSEVGEFAGFYWDVDAEVFVGDTVRGIALTRAGDQYPFFLVGHALGANRVDMAAGYGSVSLASIDLQAAHFAVRTAAGGARLSLNPAGSGNVILEAVGTSDSVFLGNGTSGVTINPGGSGEFRGFNLGSHATPANLSIASNVIRVVASASKYKTDLKPLEVDRDELFSVVGHTYLDKQEVADYDRQLAEGIDPPAFGSDEERAAWKAADQKKPSELRPPTRFPGFIADEWAEHESLRQFVRFEDGEVEGFYYDRVTVAHHEVLKDHERRVTEVEAENTALRAEVDELKKTVATLVQNAKTKEPK